MICCEKSIAKIMPKHTVIFFWYLFNIFTAKNIKPIHPEIMPVRELVRYII